MVNEAGDDPRHFFQHKNIKYGSKYYNKHAKNRR